MADVLRLLAAEHPALLRVDGGGQPPRYKSEQSKELLQSVRAVAPPQRGFVIQRRILEVLDAGNRAGCWTVPIVQIPAPLPPPPAPVFSGRRFAAATRYQELPEAFVETIAVNPDMTPRAVWGQVQLAAMLYGGVLRINRLWSLGQAVAEGPRHGHWLTWRTPTAEAGEGLERQYLDPLTRLLLIRWRRIGWPARPYRRRGARELYRCIAAYAEHAGIDALLPPTLAELRTFAEVRLALYVPPHLLGVASGHYHTTTLPAQALERLVASPAAIPTDRVPVPDEGVDTPGPATKPYEDGADEPASSESEDWLEDLRTIGRILRRGAGDARSQLAVMRDDTDRLWGVRRLAEWGGEWLLRRQRGRRAYAPRTAYDLYNAVAERLLGQLATDDPAELSGDDLVELYGNALEDTDSPGARIRVANGLRVFHAYLCAYHDAPDLADSTVFAVRGQRPVSVDANFIDPETFEWTLDWLAFRGGGKQAVDAAVLMAVLGYYAGLRRSEVAGLRIGDVEGPPEWDLVVRPHSLRRLKSQSAHRVMPLGVLLPSRHLERLRDWWWQRRRHAEQAGEPWRERLLFDGTDPEEGTAERQRQWIQRGGAQMARIRDALMRVTGDPGVRYHHLRHSFSNRLLLAFWQAEQEAAGDTTAALPEWAGDLIGTDAWRLREPLLGEAAVQRRSLLMVSAMLGHASPEITLGHYIHLADLLLSRAVRRALPVMSDAALARLADRSPSRIQQLRDHRDGNTSALLDHLGDRLLPAEQRLRPRPSQGYRVLAMPEDRYEHHLLVTDTLNARARSSEWLQQFRPPWSDAQFAEWTGRLERLPEYLRRSRYGAHHEALIDPPMTQQDVRRARATLQWLTELSAARRNALLESYRVGRLASNPVDVVFRRLATVRTWRDLIDHLDLAAAVDYYVVPKRGSGYGGAAAQLRYWRERTGVELTLWPDAFDAPETAPPPSERGWVLCRHRGGAGDSRGYWVYGIAWAFVMEWLLGTLTEAGKGLGGTSGS